MKKIFVWCIAAAWLFFLASCGGGSASVTETDGASTDFAASSISELPRATSPMASSVSASISSAGIKSASTGMGLASITSDFFSAESSMGACEMFNLVKQGIASAAQADMILCFVGYINESAVFEGLEDANGDPIDIYDGAYHIFNLNIAGDDEAPDRVKMRIVKGETGGITSFEMFMCIENGGALVQNEYTRQTIAGENLEMRALGQHADQDGHGWHFVDVQGTLDADGRFISKEITMKDVGEWGGSAGWQEGLLTQAPSFFAFSGYRAGGYTDGQHSGTYQNAAYGVGEMLGDTSSIIADLAMGDGAVQFLSQGTYSDPVYGEGVYGPMNDVEAWLGDTGLSVQPASDSIYYEHAAAGSLPSIEQDPITVAFAADEQWDCTDDAGAGIVDLPVVDANVMDAACSVYMLGHDWVNCHDAVGQGGE